MRIAIVTNWPNSEATARIMKAAKERDHDAFAVDARHCYVQVRKNGPGVHFDGKVLTDIDAVIPRFTQSATSYGAAIVRQFEMMGVYTTTKSIAIVRAADKLRTLQLLAKSGIEIPNTAFSMHPKDIDDFIDQIGGAPVIIKLIEGSQGSGVAIAETRKAARSVIQAFQELKANIIIQEFISESGGSDIRAFVVGNKVVASMQRTGNENDFRSNIHQGGEGKVVKLTEEERKLALKAARSMGLAICGVDMLRSSRGPLVIEVNSTPGMEIETITNRDVAGKIIEYIELNAKRRNKKDRVGA